MAFHHTSNPTAAATIDLLHAVHPCLLSREEIRREIDDEIGVDDALAHALRLGMAHRIESDDGTEFFFATRTAMAAEEGVTAIRSADSAALGEPEEDDEPPVRRRRRRR